MAKEVKKLKQENKVRLTGRAFRVLQYPLVTEKGTYLNSLNKYIFAVARKTSKMEVKKAVEEVYNVKVDSVNMICLSGKARRYGKAQGRTNSWKKAIVTLKEGQSIQIIEGV